jgi:hypothetical protein
MLHVVVSGHRIPKILSVLSQSSVILLSEISLYFKSVSSSVPTRALLILCFLNGLQLFYVLQTLMTLSPISKPVFLSSCWCQIMVCCLHPFGSLFTLSGLLIEIFSDSCWLVRLPGITATCVFHSLTACCVASIMFALNWSHTRLPRHFVHIFSSHCFI